MTRLEAVFDLLMAELASLPREAVLATVSPRGAEARVLMLRSFDQTRRELSLYTDAATPKLSEMSAVAGGTLLLRNAEAGTQLRLRVTLRQVTPDPQLFAALPLGQLENYGTEPPPGTPIPTPDAYRRTPQAQRFAVILARIDEIDFVDLVANPHLRAQFTYGESGWRGSWLAP